MLFYNRLQLIRFFLVLICFDQMTTSTTKTCWPELVGKIADEAVQVIKEESGLSKVHVCGPGSRTTRDIDDERVRVYVDENDRVTTEPIIG
ncbi:unnamed protein product [Rotaria sp. Silwood2]|nr:unnamed protein product [Rotaria sp. Silwood2]CAF2523336.1 unnamed protein product [Rotaria sp. Silwood2]CAF2768810.1 unnamed protein product [Rotaria sp. Silwood2]CAF2944826.1 unnamed protein product [Rotaria sp. Silwood2]CAF4131033.1 unnamed protein product [Rotaria sp. Silwood2]